MYKCHDFSNNMPEYISIGNNNGDWKLVIKATKDATLCGFLDAGSIGISDPDEWFDFRLWINEGCKMFEEDDNSDLGKVYIIDYIKSLGVDAIWFSPLYPSPNADFGYDVADYKNINPEYGDLEVFKEVLSGAHERGMRVFMDLVVNHTSDEHEWFKQSRDIHSPYRNYYFWRPGRRTRSGGMKPPNNWDSLFEGGAWELDPQSGEY